MGSPFQSEMNSTLQIYHYIYPICRIGLLIVDQGHPLLLIGSVKNSLNLNGKGNIAMDSRMKI